MSHLVRLIGGRGDSEYLKVASDSAGRPIPEVRYIPSRPATIFERMRTGQDDVIQNTFDHYILSIWHCGGKEFYVYRHESLGEQDVFPKLLEGYTPYHKRNHDYNGRPKI